VLRCIARAGDRGITDEAIASELDINPSTERPRRIELLSDGLIEATGEAMTRSGRRAIAWGATAEGISLVCDEDRHSDAGSEGGR
jgi:predicted ArsR family transcriptional regulator